MLLKAIVLAVCVVGYGAASSCPSSVETAYFKGECSSSSDYNWYSYTSLKSALSTSWSQDIQTSVSSAKSESSTAIANVKSQINAEVNKLETTLNNLMTEQDGRITELLADNSTLMTSTRSYVDQELNDLNQTLASWKEAQDTRIMQVLVEQGAVISKLVSDIANITAQNLELKQSNEELKQAVAQLKTRGDVEVYHPTQDSSSGGQDVSNGHLVKTVCKIREALGVELTETCRQILQVDSLPQLSEA